MPASDAAFVESLNRSEDRVLAKEDRGKREDRRQLADKRSETLFNRATTLFEDQQKFMKDEMAQKKLSKELNTGLSLFKASGGQIVQPMLNAYKQVPDGGKFSNFLRNDADNTFSYDIEWAGNTHRAKDISFDEMGKMMMSLANPLAYLEQSGALAAAEADHQNRLEVERIKNLKNKQDAVHLIDGKIPLKTYNETRAVHLTEYFKLLHEDPETLPKVTDTTTEEGVRRATFEEYTALRFGDIGIDVSGAKMAEDGQVDVSGPPPNYTTASFTEIQQYFFKTNNTEGGKDLSVDMAIDSFVKNNRFDELNNLSGTDPEIANTFSGDQEVYITKQTNRAKAGGDNPDPEAIKQDVDDASIIVFESADGEGGSKQPATQDPFKAFASKNDKKSDIMPALRKLGGALKDMNDKAQVAKLTKTWTEFLNPKTGHSIARAMLVAGQDPKGRREIAKKYLQIRVRLPVELREKLDKLFPQSARAGAIPEQKHKRV